MDSKTPKKHKCQKESSANGLLLETQLVVIKYVVALLQMSFV